MEAVTLAFSLTVAVLAVILTGWLWSHLLGFHNGTTTGHTATGNAGQHNRFTASLRVRVPGVRIEITGVDVLLGFLVSLLTFIATALIGGKSAYTLFIERWGVDPGQFYALFIFSAFIALLLSAALFGCVRVATLLQRPHQLAREHADRISELERSVKNLERSVKKNKNGRRI
ncbi:hypothetical protein [Nocardia ninae]|uniref:hypothetical protein n=1 Tax=Nocardia ninae TaxID=356145 RepID=UPI0011BED0CD|nr:hypothetical protein [Nocardia ninae]